VASDLAEVWAVDAEGESVECGERKARHLGVANTRWIVGAAEYTVCEWRPDLEQEFRDLVAVDPP